MSEERELLERISNDEISFGPVDDSLQTLERFQVEAKDIMESLNWLVANDFMCCLICNKPRLRNCSRPEPSWTGD